MLRRAIATAVMMACLGACSGKAVDAPRGQPGPSLEVQLAVARAEAARGGGLAPLVELAKQGAPADQRLALRALGRIGGAQALELLRARLADPSLEIVGAAAGALGLAASLDELDAPTTAALTAALLAALPRAGAAAPLVIEALGRAADATAQPALVTTLAGAPPVAEAAAIALGRHGRRKLALSAAARDALATATSHAQPAVRYAAVWALSREHQPPPDTAAATQLALRIGDPSAEVRAQAIAALARRKRLDVGAAPITRALGDPDWRVAVEAMRALTGEQSDAALRLVAAKALAGHFARLRGPKGDPREAQVIIEGMRGLAANSDADRTTPTGTRATFEVLSLARDAMTTDLPPITRGWIVCLGKLAHARYEPPETFEAVETCSLDLPDHLRLPLLAELVKAKIGGVAPRRAALATLLSHADVRVRAAGVGALAALWAEGRTADHDATLAMLASGIGAADPMLAGASVEAAGEVYEVMGTADHATLDAALVARARTERDVELSTSLFDLIAKRTLVAGAAACRAGLTGHPIRARAAAACLTALGEAPPPPVSVPVAEPPPVDVTAVIGKRVRWNLTTSRGAIAIELRPEVAPWAVAAIVALTRKGFYDGLEFHRVVPNFVVQGGDPTQSGWGGPGFALPAEPADGTVAGGFAAGGVGIADAGRDSGGSQWFVMHGAAPHLDGRYTWIGAVASGQAAADSLLIGDRVVRATVDVTP